MASYYQWVESFGLNAWVVEVFFIILLTLICSLVSRLVLNRLRHRFEQTKNLWDDAFVNSIGAPVRLLIWVCGITFAVQVIQLRTASTLFELTSPIRDVAVIFTIAWFLIRFIRNAGLAVVDSRESKGESVDQTAVDAVGKLLRLTVIITASLVTLQTLGFSIAGVLTFGGVGGIAIGFAAQDLLSNFFGGLMIYLDRPFAVGDWIRSPDRDIEGTVEDIGWRITRIRTFDSRPLYVPNSTFSTISLENPSRMENRQIHETIGVRYDDARSMKKIVEEVNTYLRNNDDIDQNKTLMVNFNTFAASSMDFFIYCFTKTKNWAEYHQIKQAVLLEILNIIESNDAECAYPTSTLHIPELTAKSVQ